MDLKNETSLLAFMSMRPTWRCWLGKSLVGAAFLFAQGAYSSLRSEGQTVELPSFVVSEKETSKPWRFASTHEFTILSQARDKVTQQVVNALYRGRHIFLATPLLPKISAKTTVIVFDEASDEVNRVGSTQRVGTHWSNIIKRTAADHEVFCINLYKSDWNYSSSFRVDAETLIRLVAPPPPAWVQEALFGEFGVYHQGLYADPYGSDVPLSVRVYTGDWCTKEEASTAKRYLAESIKRDSIEPMESGPSPLISFLIPVDQLFGSPPASGEERRRWSAQLGLFARWGMFANHARFAVPFWRFVVDSSSKPVTPEMFQTYFGHSMAQLKNELSWFLPMALHQPMSRGVRPFKLPKLVLRPATRIEVDIYRGDFEQTESETLKKAFPEIAAKYLELCGARYRRCYEEGVRDSRLLSAFGLYELESGNRAKALLLLEEATDQTVLRPSAYIELAKLRIAEAGATRLNPIQISSILKLFFAARKLQPPLPELYTLAAETLERADRNPSQEELSFLWDGARLFPRNIGLSAQCARVLARWGHKSGAINICNYSLTFCTSDDQKQLILALIAKFSGPSDPESQVPLSR